MRDGFAGAWLSSPPSEEVQRWRSGTERRSGEWQGLRGGSSLMREVCRDLQVPFLHIGLDGFDPRYTTVEEIKDKFSQFFTAMGF